MSKRSRLADYVDYMRSHANVMRAFNPCQFQPTVLSWFMTKLEEAEASGNVPSAPIPQAYLAMDPNSTYVPVTAGEAYEIMGAKLAHIFFVEVGRKVPWTIAAYRDSDLATLFNVCEAFAAGCTLRSYGSGMQYVVDHSPRVVWDVLRGELDAAALVNPQAAMVELVKHTRTFRHGSNLDPHLGAVTIDTMVSEQVSRSGCQSMAAFLVSVAAALNIPGSTTRGYYEGTGHRTALFKATDQVLAHGDDVYFGNVPSSHLLDSYTRWVTEVLNYRPYEGVSSPAGYNSQKHRREVLRLFPSNWTMAAYCGQNSGVNGSGRSFLETSFGTYATADQITDLEGRILATTANCSVIPADDPEAQVAPGPCTTCPAAVVVSAGETGAPCTTAAECADGNPCNADECVAGTCRHEQGGSYDAVLCELERFGGDVCAGDAVDPRLERAIGGKIAAVGRRVQIAARNSGRSSSLLRGARRALETLEGKVDKAVRRKQITGACGTAIDDRIQTLAALIDGIG